MENIEKIKAELQALNEAHDRAYGSGTGKWLKVRHPHFFDRSHIVAEYSGDTGEIEDKVTVALDLNVDNARAIVGEHNALPKLTDALSRVLKVVGWLESAADVRDREAARCREEGKYDHADLQHRSANRMRAVHRAIVEEISEAFGLDAANTQEDENNGNS